MEELRNGNTAVLEGMDATTKINYALALQQEVGIVNNKKANFEAVGQALQELLKQQREIEENRERMRKEHIEREAKNWARTRSIHY